MTHDVQRILQLLNFDEKEITLYLASLEVGQGTLYEIAKRANIKRPTAYSLAHELIAKDLMTTVQRGSKVLYQPTPPRRLTEIWKGKVEALAAFTPELNHLYQKGTTRSRIQIFEGERGVDAVYSELTPPTTKGQELCVFGSIASVKERFGHRLPIWKKVVRNKRNRIRELIPHGSESLLYAAQTKKLGNPHYHIRVLNHGIFGANDNIIFQNKIAIFSLQKDYFAIVIESDDVVITYRTLFETTWRMAREI